MRIDDGVALIFHQVRFEQDPFSCYVQTEALDSIENHARKVAVITRCLQDRNSRFARLPVASLLPGRFPFSATSQRRHSQRGRRLQEPASRMLLVSSVEQVLTSAQC